MKVLNLKEIGIPESKIVNSPIGEHNEILYNVTSEFFDISVALQNSINPSLNLDLLFAKLKEYKLILQIIENITISQYDYTKIYIYEIRGVKNSKDSEEIEIENSKDSEELKELKELKNYKYLNIREILEIPEGKQISDIYNSGEQLVKALVIKGMGKIQIKRRLNFLSRIPSVSKIFKNALEYLNNEELKELKIENSNIKTKNEKVLNLITLGIPDSKVINCSEGFIAGEPIKFEKVSFTYDASKDVNSQVFNIYDELCKILDNYKYIKNVTEIRYPTTPNDFTYFITFEIQGIKNLQDKIKNVDSYNETIGNEKVLNLYKLGIPDSKIIKSLENIKLDVEYFDTTISALQNIQIQKIDEFRTILKDYKSIYSIKEISKSLSCSYLNPYHIVKNYRYEIQGVKYLQDSEELDENLIVDKFKIEKLKSWDTVNCKSSDISNKNLKTEKIEIFKLFYNDNLLISGDLNQKIMYIDSKLIANIRICDNKFNVNKLLARTKSKLLEILNSKVLLTIIIDTENYGPGYTNYINYFKLISIEEKLPEYGNIYIDYILGFEKLKLRQF